MKTKIFITMGIILSIGAIYFISISTSNNDEKSSSIYSESDYVVDESDMVVGAVTSASNKSLLTSSEVAGLIQMREEEKLARDVYTTLGNKWGIRIFSNIASSEQTHTDAIKLLIEKYEVTDPVAEDKIGVFTSKSMQELYDKLIAEGELSAIKALIVGAIIEDLDIRDLEILKKDTKNEDILSTYNNLQKGSRNHMRAFIRNIEANGGKYSPQYISEAEFNTIISAPQERGRY